MPITAAPIVGCLTVGVLALARPATPPAPLVRSTPAATTSQVVALAPAGARSTVRLAWSPKGASVRLEPRDGGLVGTIALGPAGTPATAVRLDWSPASEHVDRLWIDLDRDGVSDPATEAGEHLETTPNERRGKWWSSFTAELRLPVPATRATAADGAASPTSRAYPVSLWFVADPLEPSAAPVLRWSRRGWHEGQCTIDGRPAHVLVTERTMDGVFDRRDAWMIAREPKDLGRRSRSLSQHAWLDGVAWLPLEIDPHGRHLRIERFDPGITEAEESAKADVYRVDREAPRAERPLVFGHDFEAALAAAKRDGTRVFVDFETTWCGPCKQMDQWVYTAAAVVKAAEPVVAVKLDGDVERELVKRYAVRGYPTMLMLDGDGRVLKRAVGYRGVAEMAAFIGGR